MGRPNVGKSTLFNRIVGRREALVDDQPGVTRDRLVAEAEWIGRRFALVDTGGLEAANEAGLAGRVREQSLRAASEADVVVLVVDGRSGRTPADDEAARVLARTGRPLFCVVNKIDGAKQEDLVHDFWELGLGEPIAISAEHSRGIDELLDRIVESLPEAGPGETPPAPRLAIVGRPNVGKSSLLNRLVGEERVLVDEVAGTTRDAVDIPLERDGERMILVDTAGIRRRSRIDDALEAASVGRSLRSIDRAEIVLLVVDASEGVTDQEARLARLVQDRGRGLLLVLNKWDLLAREDRHPAELLRRIRERYPHFEHVPAVSVSARENTQVETILPAARRVFRAFALRIPTRTVNVVLEEAVAAHEPPLVAGRRARFYYGTATGTRPPAITLFVNDPACVKESYRRYLENRIRAAVDLEGVPLRMVLRARTRPRRGAAERTP